MGRIAIGVEYDGAAYHGWQRQPHCPSVQESAAGGARTRRRCAGRAHLRRPHRRWRARARPGGALRHRSRSAVRVPGCSAPTACCRRRQPALGAAGDRALPCPLRRPAAHATATWSSTGRRARRWPPGARSSSTARSMSPPCRRRPTTSSASTTSAPFAPPNARPARRCARIEATRRAAARATGSASRSPPTRSCSTWCATSSAPLLAIGRGRGRPASAPASSSNPGSAAPAEATAAAHGLYFWQVDYPPEFGLPDDSAMIGPFAAAEVRRLDLVREDRALAHQDRAPLALGARGPVDQVPGLRRGAVPRRARAQPQRLPEVHPPHAHRRARSGCSPSSIPATSRRSARGCSPRIRCKFKDSKRYATGCRRRRRPPASATR